MGVWCQSGSAVAGSAGIEIDQFDIANHPEETAAVIAHLLAIPDDGRAHMTATFSAQTPQRTDDGSTRLILPLSGTGWTVQQIALFHQHCDDEMRHFGYTEDSDSRSAGGVKFSQGG